MPFYMISGLPTNRRRVPRRQEDPGAWSATKQIHRKRLVIDPSAKFERPLFLPERRHWLPAPTLSPPAVVHAVAHPNKTADHIVINGSPSRKRPAEDSELELVAAVEGIKDLTSPVVITRQGNTSNSENITQAASTNNLAQEATSTNNTTREALPTVHLAQEADNTHPMLGRLPVPAPITRMINSIYETISSFGEKVYRILCPQEYEVVETRTHINATDEISNKRIKLSHDEDDDKNGTEPGGASDNRLRWVDSTELTDLFRDSRAVKRSLRIVQQCAGEFPCFEDIERTLKPLSSAFIDGTGDCGPPLITETGITGLTWIHLQQDIAFLEEVYDTDLLVRLRLAFANVPEKLVLEFSPEQLLVAHRIKTLLSAPALVPVCKQVVKMAMERNVHTKEDKLKFDLSESFIDRMILDLDAITCHLTPPSFIANPEYRKKLQEEFPPPHRPLPGSFPLTTPTYDKYGISHKDPYITDFVPEVPVDSSSFASLKSILKKKQRGAKPSPKRLGLGRAPKAVRFTESTWSPRPRSHSGHNIPKIGERSNRSGVPKLPNWRDLPKSRIRRPLNYVKGPVNPDARIEEIFAIPSLKPLSISDDTKAGIAIQKEQAEIQAAKEARRIAEARQRAADERARRELEARLARSGGLRVPSQTLVQPLSDDWQTRAHNTLDAAANSILATTGEGVELRRHDFLKVVPATEWLNDEIVNGSLNWLDQAINSAAGIKDVKRTTRKCLAMSSFFFKRLQDQGVARTQRTLRRYGVDKTNFLGVDTILLPICEHSHWTLIVVRPSKRIIAHMDSMNPRGSTAYTNLALSWVKDVLDEKYNANEWQLMRYDAPLQRNGYDCGVFTITNAICIALGLSPVDSYTAADMRQQRIRIASMLLNGGFKGEFDLRVF
ncbi:Fc.00g029630.m01.CDS01 [Cosmosporella sp. VM-42]